MQKFHNHGPAKCRNRVIVGNAFAVYSFQMCKLVQLPVPVPVDHSPMQWGAPPTVTSLSPKASNFYSKCSPLSSGHPLSAHMMAHLCLCPCLSWMAVTTHPRWLQKHQIAPQSAEPFACRGSQYPILHGQIATVSGPEAGKASEFTGICCCLLVGTSSCLFSTQDVWVKSGQPGKEENRFNDSSHTCL